MHQLRNVALFVGVAATVSTTSFTAQAQTCINGLCNSSTQEQELGTMAKAEEFFQRGRELDRKGQSQEAIAEYTKAIELDPNYAQA